jgi:hypothetical protein
MPGFFYVHIFIIKDKKMAAVKKQTSTRIHSAKPKVKRPGVHAKTKNSKNKHSKNYVKSYVSQGK